MVDDLLYYFLAVRGSVDWGDVNAASPVALSILGLVDGATVLSAHTDQAGLISVLRHLHGMGYALLSVSAHVEFGASPGLAPSAMRPQ